ncbi:IS607 family transposase [bacterium]|nr:IS607 family transposase [bacterium]
MNGDNKQDRFVKLSEAAKAFGVSTRTIYRWRDSNQIVWKQKPSGQFIYQVTNSKTTTQSRKNIVYVRVSSTKQADDLGRQKTFMQQQFPSHEVIADIGSGLNFKRRGLQCLLRLVMSNSVNEIVVSSKDRLCRFGFELLEWIFNQHNTKLMVLESTTITEDQQFVNDILSIIQIYSCKWNGRRRYSFKNEKNKIAIDIQPKTNATKME